MRFAFNMDEVEEIRFAHVFQPDPLVADHTELPEIPSGQGSCLALRFLIFERKP